MVVLDLTRASCQSLPWDFLQDAATVACHLAPLHGTSFMADVSVRRGSQANLLYELAGLACWFRTCAQHIPGFGRCPACSVFAVSQPTRMHQRMFGATRKKRNLVPTMSLLNVLWSLASAWQFMGKCL